MVLTGWLILRLPRMPLFVILLTRDVLVSQSHHLLSADKRIHDYNIVKFVAGIPVDCRNYTRNHVAFAIILHDMGTSWWIDILAALVGGCCCCSTTYRGIPEADLIQSTSCSIFKSNVLLEARVRPGLGPDYKSWTDTNDVKARRVTQHSAVIYLFDQADIYRAIAEDSSDIWSTGTSEDEIVEDYLKHSVP